MAKYFCEFCGKSTNSFNEGQCPFCMTTDALHDSSTINYDDDFDDLDAQSEMPIIWE